MKIAMISTPFERTPPVAYGGTERVVALLTDEMVRRGHDVTLFATGNSLTSARLVSLFEAPIRPYGPVAQLAQAISALDVLQSDPHDVIHNHIDFGIALSSLTSIPMVTTLHNFTPPRGGRTSNVGSVFETFTRSRSIAISEWQADQARTYGLNVVATVRNAVDVNAFPFSADPGRYLAFLGLMGPHKGPQYAIEVAHRTGLPLKLAGKISEQPPSREFFQTSIRTACDGRRIEFIGELTEIEKRSFLRDAFCLLVPIVWGEPFGLVMVEALACGTPVLAFGNGASREIIEDGVSGFVVDSIEEMVAAVLRVNELDRQACRRRAKAEFDLVRMVSEYEDVYGRLCTGQNERSSIDRQNRAARP